MWRGGATLNRAGVAKYLHAEHAREILIQIKASLGRANLNGSAYDGKCV
jgi:hypothetical protein